MYSHIDQPRKYIDMNEAIFHEVVEPIEAGGVVEDAYEEFDVEAIADEVIEGVSEGLDFWLQIREDIDTDEYWKIVWKHMK